MTKRSSPTPGQPSVVEWIVNDNGELGVKVGNDFHFLYKGHSIIYKSGKHDNGLPMYWRPVGKREFGECCHPEAQIKDGKYVHPYTEDFGWQWKKLPRSKHPEAV